MPKCDKDCFNCPYPDCIVDNDGSESRDIDKILGLRKKKLEYSKKYYRDHIEERREYGRAYYRKHKDSMYAYQKEWREKNRERHNANMRAWYAKNRERVQAQRRSKIKGEVNHE